MKRQYLFLSLITAILIASGCGTKQSPQPEPPARSELPADAGFVISQNVYTCLVEEWASWNALSETQRLLSSHFPGECTQSFDDWAACEEFLEFSVPNPLEGCSWLEQANAVGMPNDNNAPRIDLIWHGTEDGSVEQLIVMSGYRRDKVRVILWSAIYDDSSELFRSLQEKYTSSASVTSKSAEKFYSNEA